MSETTKKKNAATLNKLESDTIRNAALKEWSDTEKKETPALTRAKGSSSSTGTNSSGRSKIDDSTEYMMEVSKHRYESMAEKESTKKAKIDAKLQLQLKKLENKKEKRLERAKQKELERQHQKDMLNSILEHANKKT